MVRRARHAPAEAALDRTDVDDRLRAAVAVCGVVLPGRHPLHDGREHLLLPDDRVLGPAPLAERRVDEVPVDADPEPEGPEVAEHHLPLRRLAEQAHVRDAAVRDEVARARRVAAVLGADRVALLGLLDLAADGRDQHVPAEPHAGVLQRAHRLDVAGERALHVRDAEPVEAPVADECLGLEARHAARATARDPSTTCPCGR